jgi:hypothetical protein
MPTPRDPDDPKRPPADAPTPEAAEPHGVVESLRHELQEAVEHVPQPVRWTIGKLVRIAALSLAGLVVVAAVSTALYLANRTELVAHETAILLNQLLARQSDVQVEIRDIRGNPFTGIRVPRPVVRFRDGTPLLEAESLTLGYSLWTLVRGGDGPVELTLDQPVIRLDTGAGGGWRLPVWRAGARRAGTPRALRFVVRLRNASLVAPKPLFRTDGLDLDLAAATGARTRVEVARLSWRRGPWESRLERLRAHYSADAESTRFTLHELRSPDLVVRARGAWRTGQAARAMQVEVERVRWAWLAKVFDNRTFDVPGNGRAKVDAVLAERVRGRFDAVGDWDSLAVTGTSRFGWDGTTLTLDSLRGRSRAGDLAGFVRWNRAGWAVGGEARAADPAHWHALRLVGWPSGRMNGRFEYAVDTRDKARPSAVLTADLDASQWAGWVVDSARVRVDFPAVAPDSFRVVGHRRGGEFLLSATVDAAGWRGPYHLRDLPLEEWPDGRATGLAGMLGTGAGTVESRRDGLFVTGDLEGHATVWSAAAFARWRMGDVRGRLLPTPQLTAAVTAEDGFFVGIHLDSANASLELGDRTVTFTPLVAFAGDTLFAMTGIAGWEAERWRMTLTSAQVRSDQFDWRAEPPVTLGGDRQGVVFDRLIARDGEAELSARGRWASPGGFYDFVGETRGVEVGRVGLPLDWGLGGRADTRLEVTGRAGDPAWSFEGRCSDPAFAFHRADSLSLSLGGRRRRLEVRDLLFRVEGGEARAEGRVDGCAAEWPDSLTATAVVRWLAEGAAWDGTVRADRLPIEGLGRWSPQAAGWSGRASGTLQVAGRPGDPRLEVRGHAAPLTFREFESERLEAEVSFREQLLEVPLLRVSTLGVVSTVHGRMPLVLALGREPQVPDAPMAWTADVPRGDLRLLPLLVPQIQSARGRFDMRATVGGTTRRPRLDGDARIREGTVRPVNREEVLTDLHADLHFDEARVRLDSLSARQGRSGRVWSKGVVELDGFGLERYRFDLALRDFSAREEGLYAVLFDGDFVVVDGPRVAGQRLPQVAGDVRLQQGVVEFDFANQSEVQKRAATTQPLYWTYRIHVGANSNLRWRPPDGDLEFNADLDLEQTPDSLIIYGEMQALRGTYYFLSNRFRVTDAQLQFDNLFGVDPLLDITAETQLRPLRPEEAGGEDLRRAPLERITARITGRSSQPLITLASDSDWDQRRILSELTYGRFSDEGGSGSVSLSDPLDHYLSRQLNNQLSENLSEFFRGAITEWEVQRQQGGLLQGGGGLIVGLGTQVTPQLALRYRQRLPGLDRAGTATDDLDFERDVEAEYRINRFIYFTTELTQRRNRPGLDPAGSGRAEFNLNLKARWEY